jgi:GTPase SAR1 family protein
MDDDTMADNPSATGRSSSQNFKVVLLGEGCVGKTSLVLRYTEDKFNDKHVSTLQVGQQRPFV